jgi:hypothetical protein
MLSSRHASGAVDPAGPRPPNLGLCGDSERDGGIQGHA